MGSNLDLVDHDDVSKYFCLIRQQENISLRRRLSMKLGEVILAGFGPPVSFMVPSVSTNLIFMHRMGNMKASISRLRDPLNHFNLDNVTQVAINSTSGNRIGAWYSPVRNAIGSILFCHGSGGNRGWPFHRVKMLKILRSLGYNVLTIDYSGYGDSSGEPSHATVIEDVISSFKHLCECSPGPHLIYAHSLGTSIAVEANQQLCLQQAQYQPDGLILDAPLHSVRQEILDYPHGRLMQKMYTKKFFEKIVDYHLTRHNIKFETYKQILDITNPILLLQAEDDKVVRWQHAQSHFYRLCEKGSSRHVRFVLFEAWHQYRHDGCICFPQIGEILTEFVETINAAKCNRDYTKYHADVM